MTDWTGENLKVKLLGASHADFVGAVLSGIKKGEKIDMETVNELVSLRRPNASAYSTRRNEPDDFIFESGVDENFVTTGEDIVVKIKNNDAKSEDYAKFSGSYALLTQITQRTQSTAKTWICAAAEYFRAE